MAAAKKQGFPKASIASAIARGQGKSPSGAPLIAFSLEAMVPPSVALIIECQTDSKLRTLNTLKYLVKEFGGSMTSTGHLFERRGRIVLTGHKDLKEETVLEASIDAGALDLETEPDGHVNIYTEPESTASTAKKVCDTLKLEAASADIVWIPKDEYKTSILDVQSLQEFIGKHYPCTTRGLSLIMLQIVSTKRVAFSKFTQMRGGRSKNVVMISIFQQTA